MPPSHPRPHSPLPQPLPLLVPKCWLWCWRFSCGSYFALLFSGVFSDSLKMVFPFLVSFCWIEFCWLFRSLHRDWLFCSFFFFFFFFFLFWLLCYSELCSSFWVWNLDFLLWSVLNIVCCVCMHVADAPCSYSGSCCQCRVILSAAGCGCMDGTFSVLFTRSVRTWPSWRGLPGKELTNSCWCHY